MNAAQLPVDGLESATRRLMCELVRNDKAATEQANQVIRSLLSVSIQVRVLHGICTYPQLLSLIFKIYLYLCRYPYLHGELKVKANRTSVLCSASVSRSVSCVVICNYLIVQLLSLIFKIDLLFR